MSERFRAFSFVDRILDDETGVRIVGEYQIPESIERFPLALVSESIGQCAAMSAMRAVGFRFRPVAGIAGGVDFEGEAKPGDTLRLEATLAKADEEAVEYDGLATIEGVPVVRLRDCLGPMVPMEDFDDPDAVGQRYELLAGRGAQPGVFGGVPFLAWETTNLTPGERIEGSFEVPSEAEFFGDHFPRSPVFPGTLLMDAKLRFVAELATTFPGEGTWQAQSMSDVKLRAFMPPGEMLALEAETEQIAGDKATVFVQSRRGKRRNSGARVILVRS